MYVNQKIISNISFHTNTGTQYIGDICQKSFLTSAGSSLLEGKVSGLQMKKHI